MNRRLASLLLVAVLGVILGCATDEERLQEKMAEAAAATETGDTQKAVLALRGALQVSPQNPEVNEELAQALERHGEFGDAIFYYEETMRIDPARTSAALSLARLLFGSDLDRGRELVLEAIERDPTNPLVYASRSALALLDEDVDEALAAALTATELGPDEPRAWGALATVYQARIRQARLDKEPIDSEDYGRADVALERAIEIEGRYSAYGHERAKLRSIWPDRAEEAKPLFIEIIQAKEAPMGLRVAAARSLSEYGFRRDDVEAVRLAVPVIVEANPDRIDAWETWARVEERAEVGAGQEVWKKLLERSPGELRSYEYYAGYLAGTGRLDEAISFLEGAAPDFSDPAAILSRANSLLLDAREFDRAEAVRQRLNRDYPTAAYTRLAEARAVFADGDHERAAVLLNEISTDIPTVEVFRFLAYAELANKNLPAAELAIGRAMEARGQFEPGLVRTRAQIRYEARDWVRVIRSLRAIKQNGFRIRPNERVWLAEANYALGKPEPARRVLEDLLAGEDPPRTAVAAYVRHEIENDPEAVAKVVADARVRHPDSPVFAVMEVQIALNRERYDEANALLDALIDRDEPLVPALIMRARYRMSQGEIEGAGEDAQRVLEIEPTNSDASGIYARALGRQDRLAELLESLEADQSAGTLSFVGRRTLASLYTGQDRGAEAIDLYEEMLAERPDDAWLQNDLAYLLVRENRDLDRGLDLARTAVASLPESAQAADTLGYVYMAKGLVDASVRQFETALTLADPRNTPLIARVHAHRGQALRELGRGSDADAAFALAREVDPEIDVDADLATSSGT